MDIRISPVNFKGMWEPVKYREIANGFTPGTPKYTHHKLYDMVYHPFKNETAEEIANIVKKFFKGRTYTMMDRQYGGQAGDYYQMNRVKVGEVIDEKDIKKYLDMGYTEEMKGGIASDADFYDANNNESFAIMGHDKISIDRIKSIAAEVFDKAAD